LSILASDWQIKKKIFSSKTSYRRPSIVASYKVSVHLAKQFERGRFYKIGQLETRIVCIWLETPMEGSVCIKFPQRIMKGERHRLRHLSVSKARTFVVLQLVTNVALIKYT
jgi:hypothetical protein